MSRPEAAPRAVALAGNPNVGKSSLFNALTGLHQHTGNWPGKTVAVAQGEYAYAAARYVVTDLPGAYSLTTGSEEEHIAADYLRAHTDACLVAVCDATCLARSLPFAVQLMQRWPRVIVCVNLMDEAEKQGIRIDLHALQTLLGVPVVGTCASDPNAVARLRQTIRDVLDGFVTVRPHLPDSQKPADCVRYARQLAAQTVTGGQTRRHARLDAVLTGKRTGPVIFAALLIVLFWLTLVGSNRCSDWLQSGFDRLQALFLRVCGAWPPLLADAVWNGVYATTARVTAVMLPPAAIFFCLFSVLEDVGYLPRAAFLTDHLFERCGTSGRQALTMCMGLGCNASAVVGCRIIDSPRERLIAILTNNLVPCNGRFPFLISIATIFIAGAYAGGNNILSSILSTIAVIIVIIFGICLTLIISRILSNTILKGMPSSMVLELPPYRKPQFAKILVRSIFDRTLFILGRAIVVAAPAGLVIWILANVGISGESLLTIIANFLNPFAKLMGLDGYILTAFILGIPANEIVLPIILMCYLKGGTLVNIDDTIQIGQILLQNGWTMLTAMNVMLFTILHFPCATTLLTIKKETGSWKWTAIAFVIPTICGIILCMATNLIYNIFKIVL